MDIEAWLRGLGLERHAELFRANDLGLDVLPDLTDADLTALGLSLGDRKRLLRAIAALRGAAGAPSSPTLAVTQPSAPARLQAERRQLTVMFVDLVGSTALSQRLDPEEMRDVLQTYQHAVSGAVARFEGHIAKLMGDGVLAYFGWPVAHEDEAERAVHAGLSATAAVARLAAPDGESLAARVGIATGLVVVGDLIGEGAAQEEAVIGETPNLAARLEAMAEPGQVVVAEATHRLLGGLFVLRDLGAPALKGFSVPVRAFAVAGEAATEGRFEARHASGLTPMVGREHELALLLDGWERAKEGDGQVVLVAGEPGIGKSRLITELRAKLAAVTVRLQCSPYYTGTALWPVIEHLERAAGFARDDSVGAKLAKLTAFVTGDARIVPPLAVLLGIPADGLGLELTPQRQKQLTLQTLVDQLAGLTTSAAVLLVVEDTHWIDPTTEEFLGLVIDRMATLPILAVVTSRPDHVPLWAGRGHVTTLSLARLGGGETRAIIEAVTGARALPPAVAEQIRAKTDGVPLFIEELTKTVLESGLLKAKAEGFETSGPLPPLAIPATLQDSLLARLDRLASAKQVAQMAACIGREFSHELVSAVAGLATAELDHALAELTAAELVFRHGTPPEATYSFKHALVQDAAHESLLKSRRQQLHAKIATVLEEQFPEAASGQPELLAYHLTEACQHDRAIVYLQQASRRALARSAEAEAVGHLQGALAQLDRVTETARREALEFELQAALGRALSTARGFAAPETDRAFAQAALLGQRLQVGSRLFPVLWGRFNALRNAGKVVAGHRTAQEFLRLARRSGDTGHLLTAERSFGDSAWVLGRPASARRHLERALSLYDPAEHRGLAMHYAYDQRVVMQDLLACTFFVLGYPDQAEAQTRRSLAESDALHHLASLAHALDYASLLEQLRDDPTRVLSHAARVRWLAAEQAIPVWSGRAAVFEGWAVGRAGAPEEGAAMIGRALDALLATGVRLWRPYHLALLADVEGRAYRYGEALGRVDEALRQVADTGERWFEAELHRFRGELALRLGGDASAATAEAAFHAALGLARRRAARMWQLRAAVSLARLWAERSERGKAHDLLAPIYGWFSEGLDTPDLVHARALLDELQ